MVTIGNGMTLKNMADNLMHKGAYAQSSSNVSVTRDFFSRSSSEPSPCYGPMPGMAMRNCGGGFQVQSHHHIDERVEMAAESISYDIYYNAKQNGTSGLTRPRQKKHDPRS